MFRPSLNIGFIDFNEFQQPFGDVRPVAGNKWDGGWIIDPDKNPNKKYDVEITFAE